MYLKSLKYFLKYTLLFKKITTKSFKKLFAFKIMNRSYNYYMNNDPQKILLENVISKFNQGLSNDALINIQDIIKNYPKSGIAHNILGAIYMEMNNLDKASKSFMKAISLTKNYYHAINNLGLVFFKKKDYEKAIKYFKRASYFNEKYIEPLLNLSAVYIATYKFNKAKSILKKIINLDPNAKEAYYNLSKTNIQLGQIDIAIDNLKKAISIDRKHLDYLKDLGNIYLQKGEFEIGINYLKEYLKIFPNSTEVYFFISLLKKYDEVDEFFNSMFKINEDKLSEDQKINLFFTYGKIFGDLNKFDKSFFYYEKANSIKNRQYPFDIENETKLLPILKKKFKKDYSIGTILNEKSVPIFIVGMPRSGTSLIDQILSKHFDIKALGELEFLGNEINKLNLINSEFTIKKGNLLREKYFRNLDEANLKTTFFTDKTPINFRWIGYIFNSFPNAKIIHIQRKAQATCWSNFKSHFIGRANDFSNNLENIVEYYLIYKKIMCFYNKRFKNKIYNIQYENLVNNFEFNVKNLILFLGLEWDDNCLNFYKGNRYVSTSSFAQVKKKLFFNSSNEWESYKNNLQKYFKNLE